MPSTGQTSEQVPQATHSFLKQAERRVDRTEPRLDLDEGIKYPGGVIGIVDPAVVGSNQFHAEEGEGFVHSNLLGQAMFDRKQGLHVDMS